VHSMRSVQGETHVCIQEQLFDVRHRHRQTKIFYSRPWRIEGRQNSGWVEMIIGSTCDIPEIGFVDTAILVELIETSGSTKRAVLSWSWSVPPSSAELPAHNWMAGLPHLVAGFATWDSTITGDQWVKAVFRKRTRVRVHLDPRTDCKDAELADSLQTAW
jgi:hypothetical protein